MISDKELYERLNPDREVKPPSDVFPEGKDSCHFCDSRDEIETHHIIPQRFNGSDAESNNVDLCHDCHWKLERLYNVEFWNTIGVDDPRSSRETHLVCERHQCNNQAVAKYEVSGDVGAPALIWVCAECADGSFEMANQSRSYQLRKDLREVSDDE